jgi:hypothetical protein
VSDELFVPEGFTVPDGLTAGEFRLAALDPVLHDAVLAWLERDWPFDSVEYAPRA